MPTIDATVAGASSNSFATRPRADTLADEDQRVSAIWEATAAEDDDAVDRSIITASRAISSLEFEGLASTSTQALAFPRYGLTALSGYPLDSSTIPGEIERATVALAAELQTSPTALDGNPVADLGLKKIKADVVELEWKDDSGSSKSVVIPSKILAMIPPSWLKSPVTIPFLKAM